MKWKKLHHSSSLWGYLYVAKWKHKKKVRKNIPSKTTTNQNEFYKMVLIRRNVISLLRTVKQSTISSFQINDPLVVLLQQIDHCSKKVQNRKFVSSLYRPRTYKTESNKSIICTPIVVMRELTQQFSENVICRSADQPHKNERWD